MHAKRSPHRIVVGALLAGLAVPGTAAADGTTLCVGPGHGCFGTLQAAVDAARDASTITIAPGIYRGGVVVTRSVQLAGSGAGRTIIRGGGPVLTLAGTITVSDLTVTGGVTSTNPHSPGCGPDVPVCGPGYADATALGGGIEALPGSAVTLVRTAVATNRAEAIAPYGRFADGGGIFVDAGGTLTVDHSAITGNRASLVDSIRHPYPQQDGSSDGGAAIGGGLFIADGAGATIRHSRLDDNQVTVEAPLGEPIGDAAALCSCTGLPLTISDTTIAGNRLSVDVLSSDDNAPSGPAALDSGGPTTIRRTGITGNRATVTAAAGGAGSLGEPERRPFRAAESPTPERSCSTTPRSTTTTTSVRGADTTYLGPTASRTPTGTPRRAGSSRR